MATPTSDLDQLDLADPNHRSRAELEAGLAHVAAAPAGSGTVELLVRRPSGLQREVIESAELTTHDGVVGDNWRQRGSRHTPDGSAELDRQLTLMNARAAALVAGPRERWPLAGDQLYVDLDVSAAHLPAGTRLAVGAAVIEITAAPHTACQKFTQRFGVEATRVTNTPEGRRLHLRGRNAKVVQPGTVRVGDAVTVLVSDGIAHTPPA